MIVTCPACGAKNRVDEAKSNATPVCGKCKTPLTGATQTGDSGHPLQLTDANFERELSAAGGRPVLVDFWATWCPPCRAIAPAIEQLAGESAGRWVIGKLDIDANPVTAQRFRIESIPTMLIFKNGGLVDQLVGLLPKPVILAKLESHAR